MNVFVLVALNSYWCVKLVSDLYVSWYISKSLCMKTVLTIITKCKCTPYIFYMFNRMYTSRYTRLV